MTNVDQVRHLRTLSRRIRLGNCVLALGPGVSSDPFEVKLAREFASDSRVKSTSDLNCEDLRHVTQVFYEHERDLTSVQDRVVDFYAPYSDQTSSFHLDIAALPFRLCITTTPDNFLYNAFARRGKSPRRHFYNFRRVRSVSIPEPTVDQPVVYHLYGYPDDPDSLVITENDLIDFLVTVVRNDPPLPSVIRAALSRPETTCLFIDVGFKNWYLRVLLRALQLYGHTEVSVALENQEFFAQSSQHQTTVYFSASKTIQFRQDSVDEFARNLRSAYEGLSEGAREPAPELLAASPRVFLSYLSDDRDSVDRLAEDLKIEGIAIWQDKHNLRAGDNWERALMQVINKQVDYVVVVQSTAMSRRVESYFYREIGEALERQRRMKEGVRFIIPVQMSGATVLPILKGLHSIPVGGESGVKALAGSILEDWKRRPPAAERSSTESSTA